MTSLPYPLARLAELCGIETEFGDAIGRAYTTLPESVQAILAAMGVAAGSEAEMHETIAAIEAEARERLIAEAIILRPGSDPIMLPEGAEWRLELEGGGLREGVSGAGLAPAELPVGVHRLTVSRGGRSGRATLLVSPRIAPDCQALTGRHKVWGLAVPLYGLCSERNLGLGTYGDLAEMAEATGPLGVDYLAINPVHALFPLQPRNFSPYSPSHRRFFNTAHIDPRSVPELAASDEGRRWLAEHGGEIDRLRRAELIDYPSVAALLQPLLEWLFEAFEASCPPESPRGKAFAEWCAGRGAELDRFATHQALSEKYGAIWHDWPKQLLHPEAREVARFAAQKRSRIRYHKYLQWLAAEQLDGAQARARAAGMGLGLVADLAVGVNPEGAETWAEPELFARGISLGAPPDAFNAAGQNWGLAPFIPAALRRDTYRAFAGTLARSMRWSGAIRIDHIVGFRRGYWIPQGHKIGAYVQFPVDEMLAVAAIEGHRQQCLVIGEDLGNVPAGLRDKMEEIGIHGCRLVYFERNWSTGAFLPPEAYRHNTAASLGSHDLPSFQGWWAGRDIDLLLKVGTIDEAEAERERGERVHVRRAVINVLREAGMGVDTDPDRAEADEALVLAIHRFLGATGSALATVQAETVFDLTQLNMPGTVDEHANWRIRLPPASAWRTDRVAGKIARIMSELRPRG